MTILCYKKMEPALRLADKIKSARETREYDVNTLSKITRIPLKYLTAIETSDFQSLPKAKAHRVAYIKELSRVLELPTEECLKEFVNELGLEGTIVSHPHKDIKHLPFSTVSIFLRNAFVAGLVIMFTGYLVWQIKGVLKPPTLDVFSPSEGYLVSSPKTTISGETEKESKLTINGESVMVDENGKFSTEVDLENGVNTVQITATKKHGKTTSVTRHIIVRMPTNNNITLSPPEAILQAEQNQ